MLSALVADRILDGRVLLDVVCVSILLGLSRFEMLLVSLVALRCLVVAEFGPLVIKQFLLGFIPWPLLVFVSPLLEYLVNHFLLHPLIFHQGIDFLVRVFLRRNDHTASCVCVLRLHTLASTFGRTTKFVLGHLAIRLGLSAEGVSVIVRRIL